MERFINIRTRTRWPRCGVGALLPRRRGDAASHRRHPLGQLAPVVAQGRVHVPRRRLRGVPRRSRGGSRGESEGSSGGGNRGSSAADDTNLFREGSSAEAIQALLLRLTPDEAAEKK